MPFWFSIRTLTRNIVDSSNGGLFQMVVYYPLSGMHAQVAYLYVFFKVMLGVDPSPRDPINDFEKDPSVARLHQWPVDVQIVVGHIHVHQLL